MRSWVIRLLLALVLPVMAAAQAQLGKPDALPPATAAPIQPQAGGKPPPLPPTGGTGGSVAPGVPQGQSQGQGQRQDQGQGQAAPRCAQPIANNCLAQQSACQVACPPLWSTNPNAPAFTPTDRAGCMGQCQQRYFSCMRLYGCM